MTRKHSLPAKAPHLDSSTNTLTVPEKLSCKSCCRWKHHQFVSHIHCFPRPKTIYHLCLVFPKLSIYGVSDTLSTNIPLSVRISTMQMLYSTKVHQSGNFHQQQPAKNSDPLINEIHAPSFPSSFAFLLLYPFQLFLYSGNAVELASQLRSFFATTPFVDALSTQR
jgi:hypothetical protein